MRAVFTKDVVFPAICFLIWNAIILGFQIFFQPLYKITKDSSALSDRLFNSWTSYWDAGHYLSIAVNGYNFPQQAFFPLWPLLIKAVSLVGIPPNLAIYFLSSIFGLSTFILFYILATRLVGKIYAKYALILFISFPSTLFLHAGYTEGLFLTLVLLSFLLLEKKLYFMSAIVGGLTTLTRLAGIGISASYFFLKQSYSRKLLYIGISLTGLLFYVLFLHVVFDNGFLFINSQQAWCEVQGRCQFNFPLAPLMRYFELLIRGWVKPNLSSTFIDWFFSVLFIILLIPVYKKLRVNYFSYSLTVILLPLFSSTVGMIRYLLVAFPVFFVFPTIIREKLIFFLICLVLFLLQLRFVALFSSRIWVA